ncbi:MFS transporter [Nocardia sp. NBC_00511]|uniref:MFS transporter n=1 Tax=Nocardia sp. NBC_00511 TaxID=2903591 RepID=UPI0030E2624B
MPAPSSRAASTLSADRIVRTTVVLLFSAWLIDYVDRFVISLALPAIGVEFDLSRGQQGLVVSAFFLAYALCQIPGGMIADRFGGARVMLWALLAWSLFTALTGYAWSFAALLALRFAFGLAEGAFPAASIKVLVERTTLRQRMSANGIIMSSNSIAAVLTPVLAPILIVAFGWRSIFWSAAAVGLLVSLAVRRWLPEPTDNVRTPGFRVPVRVVLRSGVLWRFAAIMFGYNVIGWGLSTWAPTYLSEERGLPLTTAGPLMAIPALGAALATIVGGRLSDRLAGNHRLVIVPAMTVAAIALLVLSQTSSFAGFAVCSTIAVFSASLAYMPIYAVPMRSLPPAYVGVGSSIIGFGGQLAGMVSPAAMGVLADRFSFQAAFGFLVVGAVIAAVMAVFTPQDTESFLAATVFPGDRNIDTAPAAEHS